MLLRRVIPCLDVDKGRVVKGVEFVDLRDAGDPVELAVRYQDEGADEIVFLDITASHERRETVAELARRCADDVFIPFTIGGGVRSVEDAQAVLDAGADKVSVNSAAVARPELLGELADGVRRPVRGAGDRRPRATADGSYGVYVNGGRTAASAATRRVGARGRGARGGGDPADEHGPRRHRGRLRAGADPRGRGRRRRAGDRLAAAPATLDHLVEAIERGRRRRRAVRVDLPLRAATRCGRPRSTCGRPASRCACEAVTASSPTCASASGACPAWTPAAARSRGCRPSTWWAARCATCCAGEQSRRSRPGRGGRRALGGARRSRSAWAAARASTSASAPPTVQRRRPALRPGHHPRARPTTRPARCRAVEPAPLAEDLGRRDFTINAMAVGAQRRRARPPATIPTGAGRPRGAAGARAARPQLRRRPDAPAAGRALRDAPGLPHGRGHRARRAGGRGGGRARDGLRRAHTRRADGPAGRVRGASCRGATARARAAIVPFTGRSRSIPSWWPRPRSGRRRSARTAALASLAALVRRRARGARSLGGRPPARRRASAMPCRARPRAAAGLVAELRARERTPSRAARPARRRAARGAGPGAGAGRSRGADPALGDRAERRAARDHAATTCSRPACPRARRWAGRSRRRSRRKLDGLVSRPRRGAARPRWSWRE